MQCKKSKWLKRALAISIVASMIPSVGIGLSVSATESEVPTVLTTSIPEITEVCDIVAKVGKNGGGTVTGSGTVDNGTQVTLTAIPKEGYTVAFWEDSNGQKCHWEETTIEFAASVSEKYTVYFNNTGNIANAADELYKDAAGKPTASAVG